MEPRRDESFVYGAHAFDQELLAPDEVCLSQARVDLWGGCAWVNLDPVGTAAAGGPRPDPGLLDPLGVADMRVDWWKSTILPANWKMAQEAFMEGYHVPQTHPQLTLGHPEQYDPDSLAYSVLRRAGTPASSSGPTPRPRRASRWGWARSTPSSSRCAC